MDAAGRELLAGAALPQDQAGGIRARDSFDQSVHTSDQRVLSDQAGPGFSRAAGAGASGRATGTVATVSFANPELSLKIAIIRR